MIKMILKYKWPILIMLAIVLVIIAAYFISDMVAILLGLGATSIAGYKGLKWAKEREAEITQEIKDHEKIVKDSSDNQLVDMAKDLRRRRGK